MLDILGEFEAYIYNNLGVLGSKIPRDFGGDLPIHLHEKYRFIVYEIVGEEYLVLLPLLEGESTPETIKKHISVIGKSWDGEVIYLHSAISHYNRKRLIERKISFVIPGNQMYLPILGLDLREHMKRFREPKRKKISPATQSAVLYVLYNWKIEKFSPSSLAKRLGYSQMTLTRAFNEIEAAGLGESTNDWRMRMLRFESEKGGLWENALSYFNSPIKKRLKAVCHNSLPITLAGQSAMEYYKMLSGPPQPIYAISDKEWSRRLKLGDFTEVLDHEPGSVEIEVWRYSPELFAKNGVVDPLSLYLSLKKEDSGSSDLGNILQKFELYIREVMKSNSQ